MNRIAVLLVLTVLEDVAVILVNRGVFFYLKQEYDWGPGLSLTLGTVMGLFYITGALLSHRLTDRFGERRVLGLVLMMQAMALGLYALGGYEWLTFLLIPLVQMMVGMKWPIVESYVSAGRSRRETARALGWFNMTWATAVAVGSMPSGWIVENWTFGLFLIAGSLNLCSLVLSSTLKASPDYHAMEEGDIEAKGRSGFEPLLTSSRFALLGAFAFVSIAQPVVPELFQERFGFSAAEATPLFSVFDWTRVLVFVILAHTIAWHGNRAMLLVVTLVTPIGLGLLLLAEVWPVALVGLVFAGVGMGGAYYAALYYAMIVKQSRVNAGAVHEAVIGSGGTAGPLASAGGSQLSPVLGIASLTGVAIGAAPIYVLSLVGSLRALGQYQQSGEGESPPDRPEEYETVEQTLPPE